MRNLRSNKHIIFSIGFQHFKLPYAWLIHALLQIVSFLFPALLVPYVQEFILVFFHREVSTTLALILLYIFIGIVNIKIASIWGINVITTHEMD